MKITRIQEETNMKLPEEHLIFSDWFDSFNSPGIWVYKKEENNQGPWGLIHDGHSTILFYDSNKPDLPWIPINEEGAYIIEAEKEGEGGVIFHSTTDLPIDLYIEKKRIDLIVTFNAESAKAMHMTLKQFSPEQLIPELIARIRDILFKALFSTDDETPEFKVGEKIEIPESSFQTMMKFGVLGLLFESAKIISIAEGEVPSRLREELEVKHIQEETWDEFAEVISELDEDEEDEDVPTIVPPLPSIKKSHGESTAPKPQTTPVKSEPPVPSTPIPQAPQPTGPPRPIPEAKPKARSTKGIEPPRKKKKKKTPPLPSAKPVARSEAISAKSAEEFVAEGPVPSVSKERMLHHDENLVAGTMKGIDDSPLTMKSLKTAWYDRMVIGRTYPVDVNISSQRQKAKSSHTAVISGERKSEKVEEVKVSGDIILEVRPEFPGCMVTPPVRYIDPKVEKATMRFFVTPLSKGNIDCRIVLYQNHKIVTEIDLPTKVIDHRLSRLITLTGAAISGIPAAAGYAAGLSINALLSSRFIPLYGITAAMGVFGGIYYLIRNNVKKREQSSPISF